MDYNLIYKELLIKISNSKLKFELDEALKNVYNDEKLLEYIKIYKKSKDEKLKEKIYNNENFIKYKKLESEANLLILRINQIFKDLKEPNL